jgi:3-methyladenine DNA glycosylase/8-oxoguanine DNA glycosylase
MRFSLPVPPNFSFWRTVYSHGWCALPPFEVVKETNRLRRVLILPGGEPCVVELHPSPAGKPVIELPQASSLTLKAKRHVSAQMRSCLRLDEDLSGFYLEATRHREFRWILRKGAGRMLRSPTVFEDVVKMICTTNCSWALTEIMVGNLCTKLGDNVSDGQFTFPLPEAIAGQNERFIRKEIRAGYRAPYLLEFSRMVASGKIHVEAWRTSAAPTAELFEEVRSVKGVGPYAAGNILKLLGRYDYLGIDSWCRKRYSSIYKHGRKTSDKAIERFYSSFGKWQGLFFWLDVTKHWYDRQFPF